MLSPELERAMNDQIAAELYSSHLYLSMSAFSAASNLPGFARWFAIQADEERDHAIRFVGHVVDRGARVTIEAIAAPPSDFGSALGAFEQALLHEREVTAMIDRLYGTAVGLSDFATQAFLQWFVTEQVEEEKRATEIVQVLTAVGADPSALLMLDRELGGRGPEAAPEG